MAYFPAVDQTPAELCRETVQSADVYVVIAGFHYGSPVRDRPDVSYTELEFEAAVDAGLTKLVFLLDEEAEGPGSLFIDRKYGDRQEAFRQRLTECGVTAAFVKSPDGLETALLHALRHARGPAAPAGSGVLDGELRAGYLAALTTRYRLLELSTLVPDGAEEQPVAVTEVFVPQLVRADPPPVELPKDVRRRLLEAGDLDRRRVARGAGPGAVGGGPGCPCGHRSATGAGPGDRPGAAAARAARGSGCGQVDPRCATSRWP